MGIFDDPNKELQRLQDQLLAEDDEELDELIDEYAEEDYEEFFEEDYEDEYEQEDYLRNFSGGYDAQSRSKREQSIFHEIENAFEDEDEDEPFAVFVSEKRGLFGKRKVIRNPKKRDNRSFKIMILLEIIAILCVAIWWVVMQL